jgi:CheY-like chemotaxis protein
MEEAGMKKRIVVVDDQVAILEVVQLALEMEGYEVETSQSGSYFQHMHPPFPDLILLDIFLEGEDGRDICNRLKSNEQTKHIPVVLLSAHANSEQAMRDCHTDDFLAKPFHLDALLRLVEQYIDRSSTYYPQY